MAPTTYLTVSVAGLRVRQNHTTLGGQPFALALRGSFQSVSVTDPPADMLCRDSESCSGHGQCVAGGLCACDGNWDPATLCTDCLDPWTGPNCDLRLSKCARDPLQLDASTGGIAVGRDPTYSNNIRCEWDITIPAQTGSTVMVELSVIDFFTEHGYDKLVISSRTSGIPGIPGEKLDTWSGGLPPCYKKTYDASRGCAGCSGGLKLVFTSDGSVVSSGFAIRYPPLQHPNPLHPEQCHISDQGNPAGIWSPPSRALWGPGSPSLMVLRGGQG